jgi:hypothetical protein
MLTLPPSCPVLPVAQNFSDASVILSDLLVA